LILRDGFVHVVYRKDVMVNDAFNEVEDAESHENRADE